MSARDCLRFLILALLTVQVALPAQGEEAPGTGLTASAPAAAAVDRPAPDAARVPEVLHLLPAELVQAPAVEALRNQTETPGAPYQNGFPRTTPDRQVTISTGQAAWLSEPNGEIVQTSDATASWRGRFTVENAYAFRVLLRDVTLPAGARLWVYAGDLRLGPYGKELLDPDGDLWLPPAPGAEAVVEVEFPTDPTTTSSQLSFTVGEIMELVDTSAGTEPGPQVWTDCDIDAQCIGTGTVSTIDQLRESAARLSFVKNGLSYLCSGGLLNDRDLSTYRPYLLTAHHCFDTQSSASSLVAYFDYYTNSCDGTAPSLGSVPSVAGATLLATNSVSDFTFVELSAVPSGYTWFLGWTTTDPGSGSSMERVSYPEGTPQKYSASSFTGSSGITCSSLPTSDFNYSEEYTGSTTGGSSGSPVTQIYSGDARVVGQLYGVCYYPGFDECSYSTYNQVDGAFSTTYPYIKYWINDLTGCSLDSYEPDDSAGQASGITSGSPQSHSICPAGDEDWVSFTLGAESAVTLETSGVSGDTRMWLYDSSLSLVEFDDDGGTSLFSAIDRLCGVDALPAGTYYVKVDEYGGDETIDDYTLAYTWLESCGGSCPANLVLSNATLSGIHSYRANNSITLGPSLLVNGTAIDVLAGQSVVITSGSVIGGSFSAGTNPAACSM